jgi:arylsulfatase A-like enzyme
MNDSRRIVIVAFDGLQMSQVIPRLMPNLSSFADEGVRFVRHHAVFPTVTRLNVATLVTGCYPGKHGIAGNRFVFRDVDSFKPLDVLEPELRRVDAATGGKVLLAPSLGDILGKHGREYVAVVSGTSGNAYCHNPNAAKSGGAVIHPDFCLPDRLFPQIEKKFGPWPAEAVPNAGRLSHATDLLLEFAIDERDATVSLVWFSEPDKTQHQTGVGSTLSNRSLGIADAEFGRLVDGIRARGLEGSIDVIVVSDHGYSTSLGPVDVYREVRSAGFPSARERGGVAVAPNSGAALFYVRDADPKVAGRLVDWLFDQPWCGAVFAAERVGNIEGTLPAALIGIDGPRGPDVAISMAWDSELNEQGYPGRAYSAAGAVAGLGDHGSASPYEMRNTLIAGGPSFKRGLVSDVPSGNVDIAPTVLHLLGIKAEGFDGRILNEALASSGKSPRMPKVTLRTHEEGRELPNGHYRQTVEISEVDGVRYVAHASRS